MPAKPWPRPDKPMTARRLSAMLTTLGAWSRDREEPVVGRIREKKCDPFAVLVGTVLSLRTRDQVTDKAFHALWKVARSPGALAAMPLSKIEKAIRPVGFYKTKAKSLKALSRILLDEHGGRVPGDLDALLALPGVGRKTANLVLTEGFALPGICVDTHVHRILNWWGFVDTREPDETEQVLRRILPKRWWMPINGLLVSFGQQICRSVGPRCPECLLQRRCPYPGKKL